MKKKKADIFYSEDYKNRKQIEKEREQAELDWLEQELKNFFLMSVDERWERYIQNLK